MTDQTSLTGLREALRDLPVGATLSKAACLPVADAHPRMHAFRKAIQATVAKTAGSFVTHTLDTLADDFQTAIRCVVIVRTAA